MAIRSLNDAYASNSLHYMCNACGDINNPDNLSDFRTIYQPEDVMTPNEQILYENHWRDGAGCCMYVMRIADEAAMGLGYLFDESWCKELAEQKHPASPTPSDSDIETIWMPYLFTVLVKTAESIADRLAPQCDVYLGNNTDPAGHEILITIPFDLRAGIEKIAADLDGIVYQQTENAFLSNERKSTP